MLKISLTGLSSVDRELKESLRLTVQRLADEVFLDAKEVTPVKTGNARRNWTKKVTGDNFTVENRVPYIERLEAGASKQAPKGIIGPTLSRVKGKI